MQQRHRSNAGFGRSNDIDLFFLDIQMPDLTGLEFSKLLPQNSRVIFTTAFDQYAIDGYKVNALDLKPFDYNEFLNASTKARNYFKSQQTVSVSKPKKSRNFSS